MAGSTTTTQGSQVVQEYVVRVPKATKKKFHVMGFGSPVDVNSWTQVRMERENNMREFRLEEDAPKFGAGSEFGRDAKEEARRKKFGIISKHYKPDDQPWILHLGGKGGKKYKGIRGGGVTENASYYVFMQAPDGAFEAYPVNEWYNFKPVPRYKALSAEEAEEEFGRRDKVVNYFTIMLKKRLKLEEADDPVDGEEKPQKGKKGKKKEDGRKNDLKLTDMDDWPSDSDENSGDEDEEGKGSDDEKKNKKGKGKGKQANSGKDKKQKKKKKDKGSDEEAMEESDEGDFDDREVDYMSDNSSSSEGEPEDKANREMKGVEDEEALLKLNVSDEDEDEEQDQQKANAEEKDKKPEEEANKGAASTEDKAKPDAKTKVKPDKKGASSGESSAESSDSDFDDSKFQSAMFMQKSMKQKGGSDNSGNNSRANTPTKLNPDGSVKMKRKQAGDNGNASTPSKKSKMENSNSGGSSSEGITEDSVRRYLMRKPMTAAELLQKFRSKKSGLNGNHLVNTITHILKRLNPQKQTIKGKLYLSMKP